MEFKRHIESVIKENEKHYPVVLITGPRQVGKSTVLSTLYPNYKSEHLDDPLLQSSIISDPVGYLKLNSIPFIIDEVQKVPELFTSIKYMVDSSRRNGMYFLTGSQKFELMKGVSETLAGRISIVDMLGLSQRELYFDKFNKPFLPTKEYLSERNTKVSTDLTELWKKIHRGSMPELYKDPEKDWYKFYANYVNTYIERDVQKLENVGNSLSFLQFMTALASRTGELLNMDALSKEVGVSAPTIKRWIAILQKSNIIYLLQPFSLNIDKRVVKTPKVYFIDTGLVCYLCKWLTYETLQNGAMAGGVYETFVITEIIKSYYNSGVEPNIYFFRNTDQQEIDLLFYYNNTLYPIEIKKTSNPNIKDIKNFSKLSLYYPTLKIGEGGVICSADKLLPLGPNNKIIPVFYI